MTAAAPRFTALDGLRGFAVLLVFCVHAAGNLAVVMLGRDLGATSYFALTGTTEHLLFWLFRSHHGVFIFFLLSGYLIGRMGWPRMTLAPGAFVMRRALRIYPAFLVAFAASLAFAHVQGSFTSPDLARIAGNLVFLNGWPPAGVDAFNVVTWSLFYESTFYLAFPLVVQVARGIGSPLLTCVAGVVLPVVATALGADAIVLCWSLLFGGALLAAHPPLRDALARTPVPIVISLYLAVTTLAMLDALPAVPAIVAFGVAAALVLLKCLGQNNVLAATFAWRPLRELGRVSYSFYLVHWMIVVLVARAADAGALPGTAAAAAIFLGGFALSALAATALWWVAERPYFAWARRGTG